MDHHASRLVHNDQVAILIDHIKRDILGQHMGFRRRLQCDVDHVTFGHSCLLIDNRHPIHRDLPISDQPGKT